MSPGIGVFLQVVDFVLDAGAQDLKREDLAGLRMEAEVIDIFRRLDAPADYARHRHGRRLAGLIVVGSLRQYHLVHNDQLTYAGESQRRDQAELAHPQGRIGRDRQFQFDVADASRRLSGRHDLGRDAGGLERGVSGFLFLNFSLPFQRRRRNA